MDAIATLALAIFAACIFVGAGCGLLALDRAHGGKASDPSHGYAVAVSSLFILVGVAIVAVKAGELLFS